MRLLASTDLALRVVMLLGSQPPGAHMNVEAIALQLGNLSRNHLHKIVQDLAALGVLRTVRGAGGGVLLAASLEEVRLGAVIRSLEADQALVECFRADGGCCVLEPGCKLRVLLRDARESFYQSLDQRTLADCVGDGRREEKREASSLKSPRRT
ncbi:MAG: Rrf2 family transcriptional regulator [Roseiarcus sp.]|jgi:Rrf2 family nitric oxide-sensitive transcriptional repressor